MHTVEQVIVIYWPSTEPSIKRCTCVNKRKNSGGRWALNNNITRYTDDSSQLETRCRSESQQQTEGFGPSVTHGWATPAKMRKKCCYGCKKNLGQYSSVPVSNSSLIYNKHHPFKNKVWEIYIFIKKCVHSSLKSSLPVNDVSACKCIFVYVYVQLYCGYTTSWDHSI